MPTPQIHATLAATSTAHAKARGVVFKRAMLALGVSAVTAAVITGCGGGSSNNAVTPEKDQATLIAEGKQIFRYDTFGDELEWTNKLRIQEAVLSTVTPNVALSVGLQVDIEALPDNIKAALLAGQVPLDQTSSTVTLLKYDAVVGLKGTVTTDQTGKDTLVSVGITCALCHSTVDNSIAKGIGNRRDGWANRDLNPGAIKALSPSYDASTEGLAMRAVLNSWGRGKFDTRNVFDGLNSPIVIPPAYGLEGVHRVLYTGDGTEPKYWNAIVAVAEMGGEGTTTVLGHTYKNGTRDLVTSKLPALQAYQLSLKAPAPPAGTFVQAEATRGEALFRGKAKCDTCHSGPLFTDANERLHPISDSAAGPDFATNFANRSESKMYRTTPLKGVWQHAPYFHNGSAATLMDVVKAYNTKQALGLSPQEISDTAEFLKSL